jgi:ABC-type polar amino acid transport system ATPase subunit
MIVVTSQLGFAKSVADRLVMVDGGRIIEEGPPEHFLLEPRELRTRQFLLELRCAR